ncbi:MAG: Nicotinamide-nucleotide amidohydrolase PncC [bacterium ADurb.Bin270]|nr:MAG: Nicotinamide-nucleotide amidohydrolase PncC [bacterium ADurb.Bin270]
MGLVVCGDDDLTERYLRIEIITTGDEVMHGTILDTNARWISERCVVFGHDIIRRSSVKDDIGDIAALLKETVGRADAVIVTGGLGPTSDDLTVEAAASAFGLELVLDEDLLSVMKDFFRRIGREFSSSNEKQALIPEGGEILSNSVGTAPGVHLHARSTDFFFLPGVPQELYAMFDDSVAPWLASRCDCSRGEIILRCFGMPEAQIDEKLRGMELFGARLSFRVSFPEILLKLVAIGKNEDELKNILDRSSSSLKGRLGDVIYAEGDSSLYSVVGRMLSERGFTISTAESCTGGLIASSITDVAGSSDYFERGFVVYSNEAKIELLGVSEDILRLHGAVSPQTAIAMAEGARRLSASDYAVAVTGIAGPGGGTPEKPVGLVYIAISAVEGTRAFKYNFNRDRLSFKSIAAATAIDLVRQHLVGKLSLTGELK